MFILKRNNRKKRLVNTPAISYIFTNNLWYESTKSGCGSNKTEGIKAIVIQQDFPPSLKIFILLHLLLFYHISPTWLNTVSTTGSIRNGQVVYPVYLDLMKKYLFPIVLVRLFLGSKKLLFTSPIQKYH